MTIGQIGNNPPANERPPKAEPELRPIVDRILVLGREIDESETQIKELSRKRLELGKEPGQLREQRDEMKQEEKKTAKQEDLACKLGIVSAGALIYSLSLCIASGMAYLPFALGSLLAVGGSLFAIRKLGKKKDELRSQLGGKQYRLNTVESDISDTDKAKKEAELRKQKATPEYEELRKQEDTILRAKIDKLAKAAAEGTSGEKGKICEEDGWVEIGGIKVNKRKRGGK